MQWYRSLVPLLAAMVLVAGSMLKVSWDSATPPHARRGMLESRPVVLAASSIELLLAGLLTARLWPAMTRRLAIVLFASFACAAAVRGLRHDPSCGCFGAVRVPPWYTAAFDVLAVAALVEARPSARPTSPPAEGRTVVRTGATAARPAVAVGIIAGGLAAWTWMEFRGAHSVSLTLAGSSRAGPPADLGTLESAVVLEPDKWLDKPFPLFEHIDLGSALSRGRWVVLLVHYDCGRCARAVPRYEQAATVASAGGTRLAVVEMPPYAGEDHTLLSPESPASGGRLDSSRDWFAATPVAILLDGGRVLAASDGEAAESPDSRFFGRAPEAASQPAMR